MKKHFFLIFLLALLLIGCNNQNNSSKDKELEGDPAPTEPGEPSEPIDPKEPEEEQLYTCSADFGKEGIDTVNSDASDFSDRFIALFNDENDVIKSATPSGYVQIQRLEMFDKSAFTALLLSSAKQDGGLVFNFDLVLKSIKITASPYIKSIAFNKTYSKDENPYINVENEVWNFSTAIEKQELDKVEREFTVNKNTLSLQGFSEKRMFIHKIELVFIDEQN